jgi:hypothetical protein
MWQSRWNMVSDSEKELSEKDFIQERGPKFVWIFILLFLVFISLMWGIDYWQRDIARKELKNSPFFQVTNREFSIFLWQNPQYMRKHAGFSELYLTHFHTQGSVHLIPEFAEEYVVAPPDILYRYHTWKRLIGNYVPPRPIDKEIFQFFLDENTEWYPVNWKNAPTAYVQLIANLGALDVENLQSLAYDQLPLEVRMAYIGWFNYMHEWMQINMFIPTRNQLNHFLASYPNYARNFWRNLYPNYLLNQDQTKHLSEFDMTWFLKSAAFNFEQSQSRPDR